MARRISILLILMSLLAACGGAQATQPTAVPTVAVTTVPAPTDAPTAEAAQPTAVPAATAAPTVPEAPTAAIVDSADGACAAGQRLFQHKLLTTDPLCIPVEPQRVIALDIASMELLLMAGKKPVATAQWMLEELPILLPQYADTLKDVPGLGYPAELEKVALLKPDLILALDDAIDVKLASDIAPVVVPDPVIYDDWKIGDEFWSSVLNMSDLYAEMQQNYATRTAEFKAAVGTPGDIKVSVISMGTYGFSLWMPDSPPGAILTDAGLSRPEAQALVGEEAEKRYGAHQYIDISEERIDLADGDIIFYFTYASTDPKIADTENTFVKQFEQKPIWQSLQAVKAQKAFFVPGYWWRSQSYLLANMVLDDLFTYIAHTKATTPMLAGQ